jgi:trans-aconitate methyltransferase
MSIKALSHPINQGLQAHNYQTNSHNQDRWALNCFSQYAMTGHEQKVFDIGCGSGLITYKISEIFKKAFPASTITFVGMDISKSMVEQAYKNYPKEQYDNLSFEQGNAENIPYSQTFDLVLSFSTFHFIIEQMQALEQSKKSLKPGGSLLILVPAKHERSMNVVARKLMATDKWASRCGKNPAPARAYFTSQEYSVMLQKLGFESIDVRNVLEEMTYPSKEAFVAGISAVLNYIPEEIRQEFARDLIEELGYEEEPNGTVHYPYPSLHIMARNPLRSKL